MMKKWNVKSLLLQVIPVVIFVVIIFYTKINLQQLTSVFVSVDVLFLIFAALISICLNIFVCSYKWKVMLKAIGCELSYKNVLTMVAGSLPLVVVLPLKAGDISKAIYLNKQKRLKYYSGFGTILMAKALNCIAVFIFLCIGLFAVSVQIWNNDMRFPFGICLLSIPERSLPGIEEKVKNVCRMVRDFIQQLLTPWRTLSITTKTTLLFYSAVVMSAELVVAYCSFKAVGLTVPFSMLFICVPIIYIAGNLPISFLGFGVREGALIFLLFKYGEPAQLLSAGILITVIQYLAPAFIGLFFIKAFVEKSVHMNNGQ